MIYTNAVFSRKLDRFELEKCAIKKVIKLSGSEYDSFARNMFQNQDYIRVNTDLMRFEDGARGCLLIVGEGRRDGILVDSSGYDYARYAAFIPNAEILLTVGQYPALAAFCNKLTAIVDYIVDQMNCEKEVGDYVPVDLQDVETIFGINIMDNEVVRDVITSMLTENPDIYDWVIENGELCVCDEPEQTAEDLSDPSVTKMDMYAYGYGWDGMIPLGKERALELFDEGHTVFRLYQNDAEGMVDSREEIVEYDGLFGVENPAWAEREHSAPIEVFILNREQHEKGRTSGEWLALPADADTLRGLFERICIDRPSEGAFTVTAVRVPNDNIRDYVTKYDNLDELNMLASLIDDMADYERDKFQAILSYGLENIGNGASALINTIYDDNFDAFRMIAATNFEELGRYWESESPLDYPEGVSHAEYGKEIATAENGVFTEWGYLYFRYKELSPEYSGVVPDEYKIVGEAIRSLRSNVTERERADDKPSVVAQIKAARQNPQPLREREADKKSKGGPEL